MLNLEPIHPRLQSRLVQPFITLSLVASCLFWESQSYRCFVLQRWQLSSHKQYHLLCFSQWLCYWLYWLTLYVALAILDELLGTNYLTLLNLPLWGTSFTWLSSLHLVLPTQKWSYAFGLSYGTSSLRHQSHPLSWSGSEPFLALLFVSLFTWSHFLLVPTLLLGLWYVKSISW